MKFDSNILYNLIGGKKRLKQIERYKIFGTLIQISICQKHIKSEFICFYKIRDFWITGFKLNKTACLLCVMRNYICRLFNVFGPEHFKLPKSQNVNFSTDWKKDLATSLSKKKAFINNKNNLKEKQLEQQNMLWSSELFNFFKKLVIVILWLEMSNYTSLNTEHILFEVKVQASFDKSQLVLGSLFHKKKSCLLKIVILLHIKNASPLLGQRVLCKTLLLLT